MRNLVIRWKSKTETEPFFIGIGGGSGSGKSTVSRYIAKLMPELEIKVVNQDEFFKSPQEMPHYYSKINRELRPSYNEPESYRKSEMFAACRELRNSDVDVVILEGITVLWFEELREHMDLKIYIDVDADERIIRRIRRNMKTLDDFDNVVDYYLESVRWQHERYNAPTRQYADIVLSGGMAKFVERDFMLEIICRELCCHFEEKN